MKFLWTTIKVKDLEKSIEFYSDVVGLKVNRRFKAGPNREIAFLGDGGTEVELIFDGDRESAPSYTKDISMGFLVDDIDAKIDELKSKNIDIQSGPFNPNPNIKFFYIADPDGVMVQFAQNL
ncbi:MAG TPA: glyoxalase [Eubacteriaceae bacterium]|jgi:lactoylglutathione lyase|nr:glyoxalase [Eubacteriaceae bacterium]